ncbi:Uncharacterised protein [Vibrio cholerae]|nr:Uncharacterised protein [Vibrio cholerae]CSC47328.1 Uncharacterised protein [Vibrio cholerae]
MVIFVPLPMVESISIEPFSVLIAVFTTSIPTPRPEISVIFSLLEKPGIKMRLKHSLLVSRFAASSSIIPRLTAIPRSLSGSIPAPSSTIANCM